MKRSILDVVYQSAKGMYDSGVMSEEKLKEFQRLCLDGNEYGQKRIPKKFKNTKSKIHKDDK